MGFFDFLKGKADRKEQQIDKNNPKEKAKDFNWEGIRELESYKPNIERALNLFEQAIDLDPMLFEAWQKKGEVLEHLERFPEALDAVESAIAIDGKNHDCWYFKGCLLSRLRRYDEALVCFDFICEQYKQRPDSPGYLNGIFGKAETLLKNSRAEESVACYDVILSATDPEYMRESGDVLTFTSLEVYEGKARALRSMGRLDEANACEAEIARIRKEDEREEIDGRISSMIYGVNSDLDTAKKYEIKGDYVISRQFYKNALWKCDQARLLDPNNTEVLLKVAYIMIQQGHFSDAENVCNTILSRDPENIEALELHQRAENGQRDPAIKREDPGRKALLRTFRASSFHDGYGMLTIDNGSGYHASVVITFAGSKNILYQNRIPSRQPLHIHNIPDGRYELYFALFDNEKVISRKLFDEYFQFLTNSSQSGTQYSVTLHSVAGGKAKTVNVSEGAFPT